MWSFLRLVLIFGTYTIVAATTGWHRREARPWDFSSLKMEVFVNPMYEGLQDKMKHMWPEATLQPFLRATFPGLDPVEDPFVKSLWQINAMDISELGKSVLFLSLSVYGCSLLVRMLHQCCKDGDIPDINCVNYAKELAQSPTDKVPKLIFKINRKERDMTGVKHPSHHRPVFSSLIFLSLSFLHFFLVSGWSKSRSQPSKWSGLKNAAS